MRKIATVIALTLSLSFAVAGCSKGDDNPSCEKVTDHFLKLAPESMKQHLGEKKDMIEKCKKDLTAEDRKCALKAKDFQGIMACSKKKNKG